MKTNENPRFRGEIIGFTIRIVEAKNKDIHGLTGKVVDETANTIVIDDNGREITILKDQVVKLEVLELGIRLAGQIISGRPEERIKR
ncbi:ribonuclease P protein subunit [Candidatus Woesearchaeota archaeon]|nr:ribonuclease P protein subunit [Candidatus Woesearchaeota archaeon]MBW3013751.1 ribonuclease P protein subunit [Candidatus Woesearchaeota archaeon]